MSRVATAGKAIRRENGGRARGVERRKGVSGAREAEVLCIAGVVNNWRMVTLNQVDRAGTGAPITSLGRLDAYVEGLR